MKRNTLNYAAPSVVLCEVRVEGGYGDSIILPGFGSEDDELTY